MKKKLFSVIIPVYNVENYLEQCVKSVIDLCDEDYEIILVDDGSTDNSGILCDNLKKIDNKIIVIHQKNRGLSGARNTGINKSCGKYLMFVDSDDYLLADNFHCLVEQMKKGLDVIQYKMIYLYDNVLHYLKDYNIKSENSYLKILKNKIGDGSLSISACDKLIRRDLIINNDVFFEEGLLSEDIDWSLKLYMYCTSIVTLNVDLYVYRQQRIGSITTTVKSKSIESLHYILDKWVNYSYESDEMKKIYYNYLAYQYIILITIMNKKNTTKNLKKEIINEFKFLLDYNLNYKVSLFNKFRCLLGFKCSICAMKIYLFLKNKGIIKI